jgi:hypothetical protein
MWLCHDETYNPVIELNTDHFIPVFLIYWSSRDGLWVSMDTTDRRKQNNFSKKITTQHSIK